MLVKLALGNVRKSLRDYAVYFVTLVLGVAVFYAFNTISGQADFLSYSASQMLVLLGEIMSGLTVFLACVLGFLMVYANNYLVRRRKRELGLYQVLGMRRGQVCGVLTLETLAASLASFAVGIALGVLLSQLLVFVTAALFQERVTYFTFVFSPYALGLTAACFGIMFAIMLLFNMVAVGRVRLVDLMRSERVNESVKVRSLPLAVALFVLGCSLIGAAYVRLLRDGLPITDLDGTGSQRFLVTTVMVVAGTFLFFYALSGFLVGFVSRLRSVYWRGLNMFTLRQLNARINTASVSMAVIALILFLAITSVTGGMSICATINDNLKAHTPYDASVTVVYFSEGARGCAPVRDEQGGLAEGYAVADKPQDIEGLLAAAGYDLAHVGDCVSLDVLDGTSVATDPDQFKLSTITARTGISMPGGLSNSLADTAGIDMMGVDDLNELRAFLGLEPIELADDEYLITNDMGDDITAFYNDVMAAGYTLDLGGRTLHPSPLGALTDASAVLTDSPMGSNSGIVVVPADIAAQGAPYATYLNLRYTVDEQAGNAFVDELGDLDTAGILVDGAGDRFAFISTAFTATDSYGSSAGLTGIVSYMAVYIGFVLVISCAAILAIQQLSEVSDSQGRYRLLTELGAPSRMVYRSLLAQMLVYFLFPLGVGLAHSLVALDVVTDLVALFGHLNITGAATVTGVLFVVVYGGYLLVTYRVARSVVRQGMLGTRRME